MLTAQTLREEHRSLSIKAAEASEDARKAIDLIEKYEQEENTKSKELDVLRERERARIMDEYPSLRQEDMKIKLAAAVAPAKNELDKAEAKRKVAQMKYMQANKDLEIIIKLHARLLMSQYSFAKFEESL